MTTELERRLKEFVDRGVEMKRFCDLLKLDELATERPLMCVWGGGGMGKSSLIARMMHECSLRNLRKAHVLWSEDYAPDHLGVMRKCRDDIGAPGFAPFTDLVNYYTTPHYELRIVGNVEVGKNAIIDHSPIDTFAGIVIRDSMITIPRADLGVPDSEQRLRLTERFIEDLGRQDGLTVIFLDAVEKIGAPTARWLWDSLMKGVFEGRLPRVRIIISGRRAPELDPITRSFVIEAELRPLTVDDIVEYLARRGVPEPERRIIASFLESITRGNPFEVASSVDTWLTRKVPSG